MEMGDERRMMRHTLLDNGRRSGTPKVGIEPEIDRFGTVPSDNWDSSCLLSIRADDPVRCCETEA